ncbi:MAG: hypothetical protein BJ554DRAFT_6752, partial [Olpidium bornovanus]
SRARDLLATPKRARDILATPKRARDACHPGPPEMPSPAASKDRLRPLRARLEQLGYTGDHFGPDSAALVQRLLSDLIQTTTTCRQLKAERDRLAAEKADAEKKVGETELNCGSPELPPQLPPLRQELAHLTADNNALHLNLIKQIEERDAKERAVQLMVKRHQDDVTELKFLNSQYLHKIRVEQRKAEQERAKVEDWLRQQGVFAAMAKGKGGFAWATDGNQVQAMHSNISVREEEIARLGEQLEQARSSVVRTSAAFRSPAKYVLSASPSRSPSPLTTGPLQRVEQLESQLAFLQDYAADLEQRAKRSDEEKEVLRQEWKADQDGLLDRLRQAQEKNEALMRDLDVLESLVDEFEKMREDAETEAQPVSGTTAHRVNSLTEQRKYAAQHAGERADFHRQLADLRSQICSLSASLELTEREKKDVTGWLAESRLETQAAANERDKLIGVLESFEKQFVGFEDDIRGITAERDNIRQLYEQTLKELRNARQALSRQ